MFMFRHLS